MIGLNNNIIYYNNKCNNSCLRRNLPETPRVQNVFARYIYKDNIVVFWHDLEQDICKYSIKQSSEFSIIDKEVWGYSTTLFTFSC